jgi:CelD/BcsL family acetyltransferase involved in cellulose biosynthesis
LPNADRHIPFFGRAPDVEGMPLATALAARGGDVRSSDRPSDLTRIDVTRMSLVDALALGPAVWDAVPAGAATVSPFMSWAWHRAWADSSPAAEVAASEALVAVGGEGTVQALLPVRLRRLPFHRVPVTALTWAIGDVGCPDHLDVLATPEADVPGLVAALAELPWQVLVLSNLAPNAGNAQRLCEAMRGAGWLVRRRPLWGCPYLELCDDWDRYLATLTPTRRQTLRRKERNLRRDHAVTITDYDGDRLDEGWRWLVGLHESRWDGAGGGAFRDPTVVRLHRRFAAELATRRQLWLTTLDLDGAPAAAWYGFAWGDTVYFYQSGRDPRWDRESVGLVLMGAMIQRAIERGYRRFDFLRGEDAYKHHWTESRRTTEEITIFRPGWRGRWLRALDTVAALRAQLRARAGRGAAPGAVADV